MSASHPVPGPTGPAESFAAPSAALSAALARLADLPQRPVHEHVEVYDQVHRQLQTELAGLDGV